MLDLLQDRCEHVRDEAAGIDREVIERDAEGGDRGRSAHPRPVEVELGREFRERRVGAEGDQEVEVDLGDEAERGLERIAEAESATAHLGEGEFVLLVAGPRHRVQHINGQLTAKVTEAAAPLVFNRKVADVGGMAVFDVELQEEQRAGEVEPRNRDHQINDQLGPTAAGRKGGIEGVARVEVEAVGLVDAKLEAQIEAHLDLHVAVHFQAERGDAEIDGNRVAGRINDTHRLLEPEVEGDLVVRASDLQVTPAGQIVVAVGPHKDVEAGLAEHVPDRLLDEIDRITADRGELDSELGEQAVAETADEVRALGELVADERKVAAQCHLIEPAFDLAEQLVEPVKQHTGTPEKFAEVVDVREQAVEVRRDQQDGDFDCARIRGDGESGKPVGIGIDHPDHLRRRRHAVIERDE